MPASMVIERIANHNLIPAVLERLRQGNTPVAVSGLWGCSAPLAAGLLAQHWPITLYVTGHAESADEAADDIETLSGIRPLVLPAWELGPGRSESRDDVSVERARICGLLRQRAMQPFTAEPNATAGTASRGSTAEPTSSTENNRPLSRKAARRANSRVRASGDDSMGGAGVVKARNDLLDERGPLVLVAPIQALMQPVPTPQRLDAHALVLEVGQTIDPGTIAEWLTDREFTRLDQVEQGGDFALRGGILDILPSSAVDPLRIEFFGDEIESIRTFEISSQRSVRNLDHARITVPPPKSDDPADTISVWSYLTPDSLVVVHEPTEVQETGRTIMDRLSDRKGLFAVETILGAMLGMRCVLTGKFDSGAVDEASQFRAETGALPQFDNKPLDAVRQLFELPPAAQTIVYCDTDGESRRLHELVDQTAELLQRGKPEIETRIGVMSTGFIWRPISPDPLYVIGHHEIFHRQQRRRRLRAVTAARPIETFLDLEQGDYVVHTVHGIARYLGMKTLRKGDRGKQEEFLALQFAADAILHVPVNQIDLVQKYIGAKAVRPPLSALGGSRWKQTKAKVEEAVTDFAADLLRVHAERESQPGNAFPDDTDWQREFEESFVFTDTPDQARACGEIKGDQRRPRPMDRLLCGDVGYGKTELAIRAAFKVCEFGKQVAVLVPTTVLAEQHYETFKERLAEYPFSVDRLSRFRSARETRDILAQSARGQLDIVIGTHRLLSKDVKFADLGLIVVDEEQRFGVEHKERLKQFRATVDVLTLSATPIPRTLHMALVGLRDISALKTPPIDRRSIVTRVCHGSDNLIREAVLRELNRDGQIFFVHNRVQSIEAMRTKLAALVPEARIVVGHGQMHGDELEEVMLKFARRQADILLCTTIIESGVDIPTANTMIIDRADMFGLAELHQLRGRVGRYKHRAYCYLLLPPGRPLTPTAARRLKAIEEFSELGAGFRIAMRDLEIRGAGNVLGPEQSGHIAVVGYDLYCKLLERAVTRLKGEVPDAAPDVHIELDLDAHVPRGYIASDRQRMDVYRRIVACRSVEDVIQIEQDITDAFGKPPTQVEHLLALADLRIRAEQWQVESIIRREDDIVFTVRNIPLADRLFTNVRTGKVSIVDGRTIHWRLPDTYFVPDTLLAILRRVMSKPIDPAIAADANAAAAESAAVRSGDADSERAAADGRGSVTPVGAAEPPRKRRKRAGKARSRTPRSG